MPEKGEEKKQKIKSNTHRIMLYVTVEEEYFDGQR